MTDGQIAKGAAVRSTLDFLRAEGGDEAVARALAGFDAALVARLGGVGPTEELAYADLVMLWDTLMKTVGATDPHWMERAGAFSIESRGAQLYGGILRKSSPTEFLTQSVSLFRLFYHPGDMEVVEEGTGRAVLRLVGFDAGSPAFCQRQSGGLTKALEIAGGGEPAARHIRCALEGDAFCEWELLWK